MKNITMMFLMLFIALPLIATEQGNSVITVPTGWTVEKAAYETQWENYETTERYAALAEMETRMTELMTRLPENEYSVEEGGFTGYRIRLERVRDMVHIEPNGWHYAEFAALLDEAETFVWYTTREKTLPRTVYEEGQLYNDGEAPLNRETMFQGEGWLSNDIDDDFSDHVKPTICSYDNYMFVSAYNDVSGYGDSIFLWRSTDYGQSWSDWNHYGSDTISRTAFDVAIDPGNEILYQTYCFHSDAIPGDCWIRVFDDLNDPDDSIYAVENTSDATNQPRLSVEHEYPDHRICCMYYNQTTDQLVIARSTDNGSNWSTVHTTSWTNPLFPQAKGCQGATGTYDRFYFVAKKDTNTLTIFESPSGGSGTWIETDYIHTQILDDIDISAAHNPNVLSVVVCFGYRWTIIDYNIRVLFRTSSGGDWICRIVDNGAEMAVTPVVTVDREWAANSTDPDHYHLSYYKDHDGDDLYTPFALRCPNDSIDLSNWLMTDPDYFEMVGTNAIDTLVSEDDNGQPAAYHQIDMTTIWNTMHDQWFPAIVWMYEWQSSPYDRDPIVSMPDEDYTTFAEMNDITVLSNFVTLTPNPAMNAANLSYRLYIESPVEISLFDATGRLVKPLVNEVQTAGDHRLALDNIGLAAGIYFVRVSTDQGTETETMTIIR
jgi:hypothetical protein